MESGMTGHRNVRFSTQPAEKYKKSIEKLPETSENQVSFGACLGHPKISGSFCAFGGVLHEAEEDEICFLLLPLGIQNICPAIQIKFL